MSGLDWPGLMRLGMSRLRISPQEFWEMTPVELLLMAGLDEGPQGFSRARFEALSAAYPDKRQGQTDGGS